MRLPALVHLPLSLLAVAAPLLLGARGCSFGDAGVLVPDYACSSSAECDVGRCISEVCAADEASGVRADERR